MNTANKLTILRVFMIPVFLLVLYLDVPNANYWALAIFVIASLTDTLDGYIARHYNQTTDFGKFMDPLADKCLVTAAMLWFVEIGQMPAWALLVVIIREFGVSGLRIVVVDRLVEMLNKGVHPVVPWQGSVGACGDLAPMAHIVSVLIGVPQAEAFYQGERMPAQEALKKAGMEPQFQLKAKDCLALLNGTTMFAGMACLNIHDAERLYKLSELTTALSLEAVRGETRAFDPRIQQVRPYEGQIKAAANVLRLVEGSERVTEDARKVHLDYDIMHPHYQERVQDVYSLRCMPQVQGICRENLTYIKHLIEVEINAATDNPLIFPDNGERYLSTALFAEE